MLSLLCEDVTASMHECLEASFHMYGENNLSVCVCVCVLRINSSFPVYTPVDDYLALTSFMNPRREALPLMGKTSQTSQLL